MSKKSTTDAGQILDRRYRSQIPDWDEEVAREELRLRVGMSIIDLRKEAKLTQQQLAERMKITQPMLSQIENGSYEGSALDMLWRACMSLSIDLDLTCRERKTGRKTCEVPLTPTV